ncbi:tyrosine-type recombinase/integrase [Vagococcus salmoninarum]|uniref:Site-specific integrase n=1 Tax=Vagococcus salmoninarum TaxID=2739 RepID=A0A429ZU84_9ENTE|nr:site-specific integrase [Vagococcus salmoninarum]RST97183.1 site-specific integrase [Vagococcus salmoninarum]
MRGSVRKKGNNWYYTMETARINGKRHRIERYGGKTKGEAQVKLRQAIKDYENAGNVFESTDLSVKDYFDYWFKNYVEINLKHNTQMNYRNTLDKHILPTLGFYKLKQLSPTSLQELINQKYKEGYAKQTIVIMASVLKGGLKKAVHPYKLIRENPMTYVEMPKYDMQKKKNREDLKIFTLNDFKVMQAFVQPSNSFYLPMMIAFHTGLRRSEVCGLTWDNIDLLKGTLTVEKIMLHIDGDIAFGTPKTQSSYRTISIGETLVDILKRHRLRQKENQLFYGQLFNHSDYVCTKENGKPVTPNSIKWSCSHIREHTGIQFNFHSFRHTHATLLLENGAKPKAIQARLGHSRIATTLDTYSHVTQKMKEETVNILEEMIRNNN